MTDYTIKIVHMKGFGFFLAEAFDRNGRCFSFAQGTTKKEAEERLQDKITNYYHLPKPQ